MVRRVVMNDVVFLALGAAKPMDPGFEKLR
jgi:hypothetical protein